MGGLEDGLESKTMAQNPETLNCEPSPSCWLSGLHIRFLRFGGFAFAGCGKGWVEINGSVFFGRWTLLKVMHTASCRHVLTHL